MAPSNPPSTPCSHSTRLLTPCDTSSPDTARGKSPSPSTGITHTMHPTSRKPHHAEHPPSPGWNMAVSATLHCLTGCAIGEILGMVIATALNLSNAASISIAILLAFLFGYGLTVRSLIDTVGMRRAIRLAFASDTLSITTMEIVDNLFIIAVPGALAAGLSDSLFWWSLIVSLVIAFILTVPVNRWLIGRGKGHAVIHAYQH